LCQKKKVNPASQNGGNDKKKFKKKTVQSRLCDVGHVSRAYSVPPFETAGMKKKTKKKKNESGSFWKFFFKGGQT